MKQIKMMLALLAALVCGGAWATQVPYVAFDNSLPTLTGSNASSYAIKQSIDANADGSVTIGEDKGLTLGFVNSTCDTSTFIIKGTGLKRELASGKAVHVLTLPQNNTSQPGGSHNKFGLALNSEGKLQGVWGNRLRTEAPSTQVALTTGDLIAITMSNSAGVKAWEYVNHAWVKVFEDTAFTESTCHYKGFTLGGPYLGNNDSQNQYVDSTDITPATGWTISNVAMFNSILTEAQIADYAVWIQKNVYRFAPILTSTYVETGWKVDSIDELLTWSFSGDMTGNQTSNQPVAAKGWNAVKHTDGTVTVEFTASTNGKARGVSANFKLEDGVLKVKGVSGAYFNDTERVIDDMFNNDGSPINPGGTTIAVNLVTTDAGNGQGLKNIVATPNYVISNAAQTHDRASYNNNLPTLTFNLPAVPGYPAGTKVLVKTVGIAVECSSGFESTDLPAKFSINGIKSSARTSKIEDPSIYDGTRVGRMVYYTFEEGVELTVGTAATSCSFCNADGNAVNTARFELSKISGTVAKKLSALTMANQTTWAPVCTVVAEPYSIAPNSDAIFTGTLSHTDWIAIGRVAQGDTISDVALKYGISGQLGGSSINSGTPLDVTDCYAQVHDNGIMTVEMHVQDGNNKKNVLVGFKVESGILKAKWLKGSYKQTTANDRQMTYAENGTISVNSGFTEWNAYEVTKIVVTKADLLNTTIDKPSVLTNNANLKLHLDASSLDNFTISNGEVTQWNDLAGSNNATPTQTKTGNANITRNGYIEVVNGIPAFQMENVGSGIDLGFTRVTDIRTVFWVMDIKRDYGAFFLGDSTSNCYDFHRGQNGIYASENKPFKNASNVRCDGVTVNQSSDVVPTGLHVYSAKLASNASANRLSQDRDINNRNGGRAISELLIFNSELTDEQIAEVNKYLMKKWTGYKERVATVSADTHWSAIEWTGDADAGNLILTVENAAKITFDTLVNCNSLVINGDVQIAADDSLYTDGCYTKALVDTQAGVTVSGAITYDAIKTGFVGAYTKTNTAIELRAQNKEVISINIAGGKITANGTHQPQDTDSNKFVPETNDLYGLAPVPGSSWNNIGKRWKNYRNTVTLNGAKAWDGASQTTRESMNLSATATTTWEADSLQNPFLRGYLDDGGGVEVSVTGIPYTTYDVIVYATSDDAGYRLAPITVNNVKYTYMNGQAVVDTGTTDWGVGLQATPAFGKNAMIIRDQSLQTLSIKAERHAGAGRGTLCAVQVINMGDEVLSRRTYETTIEASTTEATLEELAYTGSGSTLVSGELTQVTLNVSGTASDAELVLTINPATKMEFLKIVGARPVKIVASSALANITFIDLSEATGTVTLAQSTKKVSVGEHARLVVADSVSVETLTNNGGTIRFESDLSAGTVMNHGSGTYEYKNAKITGHNDADYTIHVRNGDTLNLIGSNNRTSPNLVIDDGATVTIGEANATYWYATGNTTYSQTGGTVTVPATGTDTSGSGSGLLLGYDGNGITSMTVSGGTLMVASSSLNFYTCPTMTVSGTGHVKAKGVFQGSGSSTVTVSDNGIFEIGSLGWSGVALTMNGGTFKAFETATISSAMTIGGATTIEVPENVTLTISGAISGTANITKTGAGVLVISDSLEGYTGTITAQGGYVASTDNSKVELDGGKILLTESKAAYAQGNYTMPEGLDDKAVMILRPTGDIVEKNVVLNDRTVKISGAATNVDVVFNKPDDQGTTEGHSDFRAYQMDYCDIANTYLRFDKNPPEYVEGNDGIYLNNRPYIYGIPHDWFKGTTQLTLAVVGTMPNVDDRIFIHMGSVTRGDSQTGNWGLVIATGDISENEVKVYQNHNGDKELLTTIKVPNATTKSHSYVITKNDDTPEKTIFNIYLDGDPWETIVKDRMTITGGLQVGSAFGGGISGLSVNNHEDEVEDYVGCVKVIRAYGREISQAEISKYAEVYPYESPDGTYRRQFATSGEQDWKATASWSSTLTSESAGVDVPVRGIVTADFTGDTTVVVNQSEATQYEKLIIDGTGTVTFKKGDGATTIKSVASTIKTPVFITENSLDLAGGPTTIAGNGHVTFDFTSLTAQGVLTDNKGSASFKVTGVTTATADKFTLNTTPNARLAVALVKHADNCYYVEASVKPVYLHYENSAYSYVLADGTAVETFLDGDSIIIENGENKYKGDIWHVGEYATMPDMTDYTVKLNSGMNFKHAFADNQKYEIASGVSAYLYGDIGSNVTVGGEGTLFPGYKTDGATIAGGTVISCPVEISAHELSKGIVINGAVTMTNSVTFAANSTAIIKLGTAAATLTVKTNLAEGKVASGVDGMQLRKVTNEGETTTYTYSLYVATIVDDEGVTHYYKALSEAVAAATSGQTVTLVGDVTFDTAVTVPNGVTLDIGSHSVTGQINVYGSIAGNGSIRNLVMVRGATVIMADEGFITVTNLAKFQDMIFVENASETKPVTYMKVNAFVEDQQSGYVYSPIAVTFQEGDVGTVGRVIEVVDEDEATFLKADIAIAGVAYQEGVILGFSSVQQALIAATQLGGSYINVEVYDESAAILDGYCVVDGHLAPAKAKIDTKGYATLASALSAAQANETVTLLAANAEIVAIPANVTVDVNGQTFTGTVSGSGKIKYAGFAAVSDEVKTSLQDEDNWTGSLVITQPSSGQIGENDNTVDDSTKTLLNNYGNVNSKIEFEDCTGNGDINYMGISHNGESEPIVIQPEIVITGNVKLNNGYTQRAGYPNNYTIIRKLSGTGSITGGGAGQVYYIVDGSAFAGSITTTAKKFVFGNRESTDGVITDAIIAVKVGKSVTIAHDKTWSANAIVVNGTLTKSNGATLTGSNNNNGKVSGSGEIIVVGSTTAAGISGHGIRGLTETAWTGTFTIKDWNGADGAGSADFGGFGNVNSTVRFDGYAGYFKMANYNQIKAYDIAAGGLTLIGNYSTGVPVFKGNLIGSGPIVVNATGGRLIKFVGDHSGYTGTITVANNACVALVDSADAPVQYEAGKVVYGAGSSQTIPEISENETVTIAPGSNATVTFSEGATAEEKAAIADKIVVKYGSTILNPTSGTKYVNVTVNETTGKVELTTTDAAKPAATAIAMSTPTEGEGEDAKDKVSFTITNPIPGLFYAVSACDTPDGDFESATGDQATSGDAKTVSIPMTFSDGKKVKFYKVSVKATK